MDGRLSMVQSGKAARIARRPPGAAAGRTGAPILVAFPGRNSRVPVAAHAVSKIGGGPERIVEPVRPDGPVARSVLHSSHARLAARLRPLLGSGTGPVTNRPLVAAAPVALLGSEDPFGGNAVDLQGRPGG